MSETLYDVNVDLQPQGGNIWSVTITDDVDTTTMVEISNTVSGDTRTVVLRHDTSQGSNPFTISDYQRQAGEDDVVALVEDSGGKVKGRGSQIYQ